VRILHVNKYLYRRGGAEAYMLDVGDLQRRRGHEVAYFGMHHPDNPSYPLDRHFPPYVELDPTSMPPLLRAQIAARMLWSTSSRRGMQEAVEEFAPDVVHLHNVYHQLSPSILRAVPPSTTVVMTLHDYKLICPSYRLLDHGAPCTACVTGGLRQAVRRRCKDGSLAGTALLAGETWIHRVMHAYDRVDTFISPSEFLASMMRRAGIDTDRLVVLPHPARTTGLEVKREAGGDVLFAGRLSPEKGVDLLLEAVGRSHAVHLRVAGDGPDEARLRAQAAALCGDRVTFLGRLDKPSLEAEIRAACVMVVPSRWYENQPMCVLEAFSCGVPVIATRLGGLPELVTDGVDGVTVPAEDADALATAMTRLVGDPASALAMGRRGRAKAVQDFAAERHLDALDSFYSARALCARL
jgi:glycosyltransferase involved in cell wall biosynthesis